MKWTRISQGQGRSLDLDLDTDSDPISDPDPDSDPDAWRFVGSSRASRLSIGPVTVCGWLLVRVSVECYECPESDSDCNKGALLDNDTLSVCTIGDEGVGCWVSV